MLDYVNFFEENPNGILATVDGSKVKTRAFQFLFAKEDKVYFFTNSEKSVCKQLVNNPEVSFCSHAKGYSPVVSVNGKAVFLDDLKLKEEYLDKNPNIKSIYKSADNPQLRLFYIDVEDVETFSYSDGPEKKVL